MRFALALLSVTLLAGGPPRLAAQNGSDLVAPAQTLVDLLAKEDFDAAAKAFNDTLKTPSLPDNLRAAWAELTGRVGPFKRRTGARQEKAGPYQFVFVECQFEKESIEIKLVYDSAKQITGMGFLPVYNAPAYARQDSFTERDVKVGSGEWVLPGTLTVPKGAGPFPAIALVHGSGPEDRNETSGPNRTFQDIAWGLASSGIVVLRYDKRSKVYQKKMASITKDFTVKDETIDDALAALALLRQTPGIDTNRIFALGHSLGGGVLPRIAARDPKLAGLVILAGNSRPWEQGTVDQLNYLISLGGADAEVWKARLKEVTEGIARLKDPKLPETEFVLGVPPSYWRDMDAYNPGQVAASLGAPMLILQGERDYQVTLEDLAGWKKYLSGRGNVEFKTYAKLSHLFLEGEGKSVPAEYLNPGHVPPYVIDDIARWIKTGKTSATAATSER
jgi:dienelactone hydrolase